MYAAYIPFKLRLQVFFLQTGYDLPGPKKHFLPHFLSITVLSWKESFSFDQPICFFVR